MPAKAPRQARQITELLFRLQDWLLGGKDTAEGIRHAFKDLAHILPAQNCALFLVDEDYPERMTLFADYNPSDLRKRHVVKDVRKALGGSITSWCAEQPCSGRLDYAGLRSKKEYHNLAKPDHLQEEDLYSILWVPLFNERSGLMGLLKCENKLSNDRKPSASLHFTEDDVAQVERVADVIRKELTQRWPVRPPQVTEARRLFPRISLSLFQQSGQSEAELFELIRREAVRLLRADRGDIAWWRAAERGLVYAASGPESATTNEEVKTGLRVHQHSFMRSVFDGPHDYARDNDVERRVTDPGAGPYVQAHPQVRSEMAVRIHLFDNPVGVLNVESFRPDHFNEKEHLVVLRELAQTAAIAVQQSLANAVMRGTLGENPLEDEPRPDRILQPLLENFLESFGYDGGILYRVVNPGGKDRPPHLRAAAWVARPAPGFDPTTFEHDLARPSFARMVYASSVSAPGKSDAAPAGGDVVAEGGGWLRCEDPGKKPVSVDQEALEKWGISNTPLRGYPIADGDRTLGCFVLWSIERRFPRHLPRGERMDPFIRLAATRLALLNAKAELDERRKFYEALTETSPLIVFTKCVTTWASKDLPADFPHPRRQGEHTPKFEFDWGNENFLAHVGLTQNQLAGKTDWDLFSKHAVRYYEGDLATLNGFEVTEELEPHICPADGRSMEVRVWKRKFTGSDGKVRIMVVFWDRTKESLLKKQNELWASDFIHRVRSCFGRAERAVARIQESGALDSKDKSVADVLGHMANLVELLYEQRKSAVLPTTEYLHKVARTVQDVYVDERTAAGMDFDLEFDPVDLDLARLQACGKILAELLADALTHAFDDSIAPLQRRIKARLTQEGETVVLTVKDNGKGIARENLSDDPLKGLGLVRELADLVLNGTVTGPNGNSLHTTWRVSFPLKRPPESVKLSPAISDPAVLLVENDLDDIVIYKNALTAAGFSVLGPVDDADRALQIIHDAHPPLAVVDIDLGEKGADGGIRLVERLRSELPGNRPQCDVVFHTILSHTDERYLRAEKIPGTFMVPKSPGAPHGLISALRARLRDRLQGEQECIFVCYPGERKAVCASFATQIDLHDDRGKARVEQWSDQQLQPGALWFPEIHRKLETAIAAVLLIDEDFMKSKFIQDEELPRLLNDARTRGTIIVPVLLQHTGLALRGGGSLSSLQFAGGTRTSPLLGIQEKSTDRYQEKVVEIVNELFNALSWRKLPSKQLPASGGPLAARAWGTPLPPGKRK